jgi:sigma-B regulation protein RsbU (phosphoserine phosphatase)
MGLYKPAYEIGGDYLDYFQTRDGEWIVVVADVSGKGVPAALLMTMLRSSFRTEAQKQVTAKQLLCDVNAIFYKHSDGKSFATAICCIINAEGTAMTYARAGHPPMIKIPRDSKRPQHIKTAGVAIGMLDKDEFAAKLEEHTIYFQEGERYFVFSDGLSEARAQDGGFYGVGRVETLLAGDDSTTAEGIISRVAEDVKTFCTGAPVSDDLTLVAMVVNKKIPFWRRMTERMRRYAFSVEQWTEDENR